MTRDQLIENLSRTPERVAALVAEVPEGDLSSRPADGEFSVREHVHHLRDLDAKERFS